MKVFASLKEQSPLSRVALTKKLMQIIYSDKLPTPAEGPASMTRKGVSISSSPCSNWTRSRQRAWNKLLQDAAGLSKGGSNNQVDQQKKKENEKCSHFTWQVLVRTLRNNFGAP